MQHKISRSHLIFLLTEIVSLENLNPNPSPEWMNEKTWASIVAASDLEGLKGFHQSFTENLNEWRTFYYLSDVEDAKFPAPYQDANQLTHLIIMKCIRPDKLCGAVRVIIIINLPGFSKKKIPF